MTQTISEMSQWPVTQADVTVDRVLRTVGVSAQLVWLRKWQMLTNHTLKPEEHIAMTETVLSAVWFMMALRTLRDVAPEQAQAFAENYWNMCDAGDSVGELLWEYIEQTGLDPKLIKLPEADDAVARRPPRREGAPVRSALI